MKLRKLIASFAAAAAAVSVFALGASAYDINKDLKTHWNVSTTVPAEEFEGATSDSVFTLTLTVDESLKDMTAHDYWCVKTMINDTGWPFIDNLAGVTLSEGKDTYVVSPGMTEIKFTIPADVLETLQSTGMAFMGHGVTLGSLTFSNDETLPEPSEPAAAADDTAPAAGNVDAATDVSKGGNPPTGVEDLVGLTTAALISGCVMVLSRKRR